jgi:type VI secretion system protein VasJ
MAEKLEEIVKVGLIALGDNPQKPDEVRDQSLEFIELDNEIDKMGGLQADSIEWHKVIDTSTLILREKSKDFKAVCYLCFALFKRENYKGLSVGLNVLRDIIETHWDIAYPPKQQIQGRLKELAWLSGQLERILPDPHSAPPKPMYKKAILECSYFISKVNTLLPQKIGQNGVNALLDRALSIKLTTEEQKTFSEKQKAEQKQSLENELFLRPLGEKFKSYQQCFENLEKAQSAPKPELKRKEKKVTSETVQADLFEIAEKQRKQDISYPVPYRILRFSAWLFIEKMPIHDKNQVFNVPGPTNNVPKTNEGLGECDELLENEEYDKLINKAEEIFAKSTAPPISPHCYWLDAHRFTAKALEALNATAAKQAVIEALALFLRRFPGIQELRFNNKVAFADEKTKLWIQDEILVTKQEQNEKPTEVVTPPWIVEAKKARQLAVGNKFKEGLSRLHEGGKQATSRREQFYWWLEQARFYYDNQQVALAIPQLEFLEEQVQRFSLEEWEPTLSVEVARLLLLCYNELTDKKKRESNILSKATKQDGAIIADIQKLYARLCRLDMAAALEVSNK